MDNQVLIGHNLSPHDRDLPRDSNDGPAFVCTGMGTARDFKTVERAEQHIREKGLNKTHPIWQVFLLVPVPIRPAGYGEEGVSGFDGDTREPHHSRG